MSRKWILGAAPVLAVLGALVVTETSQAQWFGVGGRNWGVGVGQPYYGGYYGYGNGYYGNGYYGRGWGSPYYSSGWGYPYRSGYSGYSYPAYSSGYSYPATNYYTTSDNSYYASQPAGSYYTSQGSQSFYQGGEDMDNNPNSIHVRLMVPDDARVWFDNQETQQRGMDRLYVSPPVNPGRDYVYHIRAQWTQNGQQMDKTKDVTVHAGDWVNVDLLSGAMTAGQNLQQGQQGQQGQQEFRTGTSQTAPQQYQFQTNPNQPQTYGVQQQGGAVVPGTTNQGTTIQGQGTIQGGQGQGTTQGNQGQGTAGQGFQRSNTTPDQGQGGVPSPGQSGTPANTTPGSTPNRP